MSTQPDTFKPLTLADTVALPVAVARKPSPDEPPRTPARVMMLLLTLSPLESVTVRNVR